MKRIACFFSFCLIMIGIMVQCDKGLDDKHDCPYAIKINKIANVSAEKLFEFFNVTDLSALRLVSPEPKTYEHNDRILVLISKEYVNDIYNADKAAYLVSDKLGNYSIYYFYERFAQRNIEADLKMIKITSQKNINHQFFIEYSFERGIMLYENKSLCQADKQNPDYELCFKDCIGDELERISNSNWFRQARFLISAPVEFFYIMVDCGIDCAT